MGKIKQLMIMVEETANDLVSEMDADICDMIADKKDEYRSMFEYSIRDLAEDEGWDEEDLDVILEMSLEEIFDDAMFADSDYA